MASIGTEDNELITLEMIHRYVETLDHYFGNVCELDLIFNFQKVSNVLTIEAYWILDEILMVGEMHETSKKAVLKVIGQQDAIEVEEEEQKQKQKS